MAITTVDQIANALGNNHSKVFIDKASVGNTAAGQLVSLFRATGQPAQASIPAAPAVCTKALLGAIDFTNQTLPNLSYVGQLSVVSANHSGMGFELHDRIAHTGGLALNVTTSQAITGLDLSTLAPPAERIGTANFSDVHWYLSVYADGGGTASNATVNVTYNNGTTGNLNVIAVGGTLRAGREIALTQFIPTAQQGLFIRGINSVILSASTTVAGNFGFTCRRFKAMFGLPLVNLPSDRDWSLLGMPLVPNDAFLEMLVICSQTSTGAVRGQGKIIHG